LITSSYDTEPKEKDGYVVPDLTKDVLKLVVMERYSSEGILSLGWIHGFGLKKGAIASTVAHDSHNIIACGTNDQDLVRSINELVMLKGGIAVVEGETIQSMPLEVGGLMSTLDYQTVADHYQTMDASAKSLGSKLSAPFMSLSFMALLVIPELKLSDKGLFDGNVFDFCSMFHS
jgi:adenine deaminase